MSDAQNFLASHIAEVEPLSTDYNLNYWQASLTGTPEAAARSAAAKERLLGVYARPEEFAALKRMGGEGGHDPLTARQLRLVGLDYAARQMDPAVLNDIVRREEEIESSFNAFRATLDGERVTENDLRHRLREERDPARRQATWEASKQIGALVQPRLVDLVRLRNREARRLGYRDFYAMSLELQELDERVLFGTLGRLKELSEAPFRAMKAALDRGLADRWGLKESEFAPWPWMYGDPFFQEAPPGAAEVDLDAVFQGADLERLTRDTFAALGMPVDDLFERSDLYEQEGKCQHAFCTHIDRKGDVRVLCNVKPDEYWMSTMLHEFGHAAYDKYIDQELPFPLRQPAHTLSTEAIAMLMGRLTRDSAWLEQSAGVPAAEARRIKAEVARALRVGQLIFARWGLLVVHFERELYRDPERDLNALWWTMAAEFQGVRPPAGRNAPDWAAKIHFSGAPVYYQNYLLGEMTASQLHHTLTRELGAPSCAGRAEAGRFLRERYFKTGALHDWNETLRRATGETLNPDYFLKQFVLTD